MPFGISILNDKGEEINSFAVSYVIDILRPETANGSKTYTIPSNTTLKVVNYSSDSWEYSVTGNTVSWKSALNNNRNALVGAIIAVVHK